MSMIIYEVWRDKIQIKLFAGRGAKQQSIKYAKNENADYVERVECEESWNHYTTVWTKNCGLVDLGSEHSYKGEL